jgi:hypothetical protein
MLTARLRKNRDRLRRDRRLKREREYESIFRAA